MAAADVPPIETERLLLRAPTRADVAAWATHLADPEVLRYLPKRDQTPQERAEQQFDAINQGWEDHSDIGLVITQKSGQQLIGWCGAGPGKEEDVAELVYMLGKPYWGQGFATEAARAVVRYGFENRPWSRIVAAIIPANAASRRVLEHLGFAYEKDVNYVEMTGDMTLQMDTPIVPLFVLRREQFVLGNAFYRVTDGAT